MPLNRHFLCIYRFIGFEIIQDSAHSPTPGGKNAPVVETSRLTFINEPDNAASEALPIVCLNAAAAHARIAPPAHHNLVLRRWAVISATRTAAASRCVCAIWCCG